MDNKQKPNMMGGIGLSYDPYMKSIKWPILLGYNKYGQPIWSNNG